MKGHSRPSSAVVKATIVSEGIATIEEASDTEGRTVLYRKGPSGWVDVTRLTGWIH